MPSSASRPSPRRRPRTALVTCAPRPEITVDQDLPSLVRAVEEAGAEAVAVRWDDPEVDWAAFDLAVIRSTWDYVLRVDEFLAWADRCGRLTTLANPPSVLRWNADKHYLRDLAALGVPVVPTHYLAPGGPDALPYADREYVIKPTAGAGASLAGRYLPGQEDEARTHLKRLHAEGLTAMVQPYARHIETTGERALLFIAGRLQHAIRKEPVLSRSARYDERKVAHPGARPWTPTDAELAAAERALAAVPGAPELLYARVDLVDGEDGQPMVMELELLEPNLFLSMHPASLPAVAAAIVREAERSVERSVEGSVERPAEGSAAVVG